MTGRLSGRKRWLVPLSLAVSFAANDGEELLTLTPSLQRTVDALPAWIPVPARVAAIDQRHVNAAIVMMGALCASAVVNGMRTCGRGRLYQDFQWAYGLHGFGHLAAAALTKGYTTGVATSPTVVLPQLAYALHSLDAAGVPHRMRPLRALARVGGWLALSHLTGALWSHVYRCDEDEH
ncbi:HXXEE domain-containing protein [Actinomyces mediterranea]|uniref:HXXEE domain-containing protein n=1 Tax=Actinomyces mediterranea TaxID=1871028 RepID=UPI000970241B|nr:HXXEE domain-containing protein [Actinomyces mediterranea]